MAPTSHKRTGRKTKKSYTLSPESVQFLETMRKKRHASSASAILEEILQAVRYEQRRAGLEQAVADYYASLSHSEAEENAAWAEFAMDEFPGEAV